MISITVEMQNVYGRELFYPRCPKAEIFAALLQCRAFTRAQLELAKALGFQVAVQVPAAAAI